MKKRGFRIVICIFLMIIAFSACDQKPEQVVEKFASHWYKGELDKAKEYVTPDFQDLINNIQKAQTEESFKAIQDSKVKVTSCDCSLYSDTTMICRSNILINNEPSIVNFSLTKIENNWYISIIN